MTLFRILREVVLRKERLFNITLHADSVLKVIIDLILQGPKEQLNWSPISLHLQRKKFSSKMLL